MMPVIPRFPPGRRADRNRGGVAVQIAIMLIALLGFGALGTEVVFALFKSRHMQSAADSAALAAATAFTSGYPVAFTTEALGVASSMGFVDGQDQTSVAVNRPPTEGAFVGRSDAIEVVITQPQALALIALFREGPFTLTARAVAVAGTSGNYCALALDPASSGAVSAGGTTNVEFIDCGLAVNSASSSALTISGNASMSALDMSIVGDYSQSGTSSLTAENGIQTGTAPIADPYANTPVPDIGPCTETNYKLSGHKSRTVSPGVYCDGISLSGGSALTLEPGVYIIDRGDLSLSGGSSLSGDGATIVLTSSTGSDYATVSFSGGSIVELTAPESGPTAGLALFQDQNAPSGGSNSLSGGVTQTINGAVYFPNQALTYSGGTSAGGKCTQLIASAISFSGNATVQLDCEGMGVTPIGAGAPRLVE